MEDTGERTLLSSFMILRERVETGSQLGKGSFGAVFKVLPHPLTI